MRVPRCVLLSIATLGSTSNANSQSRSSHAGMLVPVFFETENGFGVSFGDNWFNDMPVQIELVANSNENVNGDARMLAMSYSHVNHSTLVAKATARASDGSVLWLVDSYLPSSKGVRMSRKITVTAETTPPPPHPSTTSGDHGVDYAFSSRYTLKSRKALTLKQREFFMPGIWYLNSDKIAPPGAIAGDLDAKYVLVREDRLPLPMVLVRDPVSGATATLQNVNPNGSTFAGEDFTKRLVDDRLQFGSIGVVVGSNASDVGLAYQFPGSEGDRTYVCCDSNWTNRSHPLSPTTQHTYDLWLAIDSFTNYSQAVQSVWRAAFEVANPNPPQADLKAIYTESIELLARYTAKYNGVPTVPFRANLPDGVVDDTSSQMGFVGKALPAAALLLRDAIKMGDTQRQQQAEAVVDFWVTHAMNPSGVPKTWFDSHPGGSITWRNDQPYMSHLRIMSEGMHGVLQAWQLTHTTKPEWLVCVRSYADFLVRVQEQDGSIAGEWQWNGSVFPTGTFTNVANHPIPFLVDLFVATGEMAYRDCALRAGNYSSAIMQSYHYRGGACDNPNVLDKEAGVLAMRAFLKLYDLTNDMRWIDFATQAATFSETWTYVWNIPVPRDDPTVVYPVNRTSLGLSLIAAGQSGADNFMAITVYNFYQLFLITNDSHFYDFAHFLERSTKQVLDWDGTLGYEYRGLMNEAVTLAPRRGHGVAKWLPWLTVAILDPMAKMEDAFGSVSLPT
eukprot:m.204228 g.204228  ORF g.204228 m.204228 type:complete len:730 (-) comp32881_c2_seq5:150-2339(-)